MLHNTTMRERCVKEAYVGCTVIGCGKALPKLSVSNDDLAKLVDTSDEWIVKRTGIHERRIAISESSTDLASAACSAALGMEGGSIEASSWNLGQVDPESIDLLICMTITPDATIPCQASLIKMRLGLSNVVAFDLNAACSGCVYGITVAENMMRASQSAQGTCNPIRRALVVGVERLSRIVDWTDRATCVLFGDGAGAVLLEWNESRKGIISSFLKNTDDVELTLSRANMFNRALFPFDEAGVAAQSNDAAYDCAIPVTEYIGMAGRTVFKFATAAMREAIDAVLERGDMTVDQVARIVPHQANERIIAHVAKKMEAPLDLFQVSIGSSANTSAASALMALCDAYCQGRIAQGDNVVMAGFGGGLTSGAVLFEA